MKINLANWIADNGEWPLLGIESFSTFLKVCGTVNKWAIDDIGLANRANIYKIWTLWQPESNIEKLETEVEKWPSMQSLQHHIRVNLTDKAKIGLYIALDWKDGWIMSYGLTNNKALYAIGQFRYTPVTKLPESEIIKWINEDLSDFNPRDHYALMNIKQSLILFDPGPCKREDPIIDKREVVVSVKNLGNWNNDQLQSGQAEIILEKFRTWVATMKWWTETKIAIRPRTGGWIDFIIRLK